MVDLEQKKKYKVDDKLDSQLFYHLFMFYRALPSKPSLSGQELARFAIENKSKELFWALFFGCLSMLLALFIPFATKILFTTVIPFSDEPLLFQLTLGLILITLGTSFFKYFRELALLRFQALLAHDLQTGVWQRIFNLPMRFFRNFETGDLILRTMAVETIQQKISGPNLRVIINALFAGLYLIPMFYFSPLLSSVGLFIAIGGLALSAWAVVKSLGINTKILELQGKANSLVFQCLFGISKVRIAGAENLCFVLWEKLFYNIKKLQWPLELVNNRALLGNFAVSSLSQLVLYAVAFYMIQNQSGYTLSASSFIAFLSAYMPFSYAINSLCTSLLDICSSLNTWKRSAPIFSETPETDDSKTKPEKLSGHIRVDRVSFRYDEGGPLTLDDISLRADPGRVYRDRGRLRFR